MQTFSRRALALPDRQALAIGGAVIAIAAALIALPALYGAILVVGAAVATVIIIRPRWGFYLLLASIPAQDLGAVGELTATNVIFALTILAWLAHRLAFGGRRLPRSAVGPVFALFVAGLCLSLTVARELEPGIATLFQWVKALLVYFLALDFLRTRRQALTAIGTLLFAGAAEGAVGLVQYLTGVGPASFAIGDQFSRAFGTFGRPNSYAGYLEMIFPLGASLFLIAAATWRARRRAVPSARPTPQGMARELAVAGGMKQAVFATFLALGATGLVGAAIFASYSRGAWLGTASAFAVAILLLGWRARATTVIGAMIFALVLLAGGTSFLSEDFTERLSTAVAGVDTPDVRTAFVTPENFSTLERKAHWAAGLAMFADNPFLGVGLGNFNVRFSEYTVSPTFLFSQGHAHNYYIHVAAEAGLVGLSTYLLLLGTIVLTGLRALATTNRPGADPTARIVTIGCLAVVAAVGVHNLFENLHVLSMGVQLSTIWALLTIVAQPDWSQDARAAATPVPELSRDRA